MLRVAIVGDHGSGKTTFLGLLYAALVSAGADRTDNLRFHAGYESLEEITLLFQRLMSGSFPDAATKEGVHGMRLELALRRPKAGGLSRLGPKGWTADVSTTIHFTLAGDLPEEGDRVLRPTSKDHETWGDVLDSDVLLIFADVTTIVPKGADGKPDAAMPSDAPLASLLSTIERWRSKGGRRTLHPIFVLSKFDLISPQVRRAAGLSANPPGVDETAARASYATSLLASTLPRTLAKVESPERGRLRLARPAYFFSWVRTEPRGPGRADKIRLHRADGAGWEIDASKAEHLALIERLAEIASQTKD